MSDEAFGELGQSLIAHHALGPAGDPWLDVHEGRLDGDEVARRLHGKDPDDDISRFKAVFERRFDEHDRGRFDGVLALYRDSAPRATKPSLLDRWLRWGGIAFAAALLLWWLLPPKALGTYYDVELRRDVAELRDPFNRVEVRTYWANRSLEVWLRPAKAVDGPVEVAVYARRDGETRRLTVEPETQGNGAVHIVAEVESLGLAVGEWELLFMVGREGTLPDRVEDLAAENGVGTEQPYVVRSARIRIVPPRSEPPAAR